jgi:hypothetical protein
MALDILPGPHPFIGDCHGLLGINVFQNTFRGIRIQLTAGNTKHQAYRYEQAKQNLLLIHFFLLGKGVIPSQAAEMAVAPSIDPAVAHMADDTVGGGQYQTK